MNVMKWNLLTTRMPIDVNLSRKKAVNLTKMKCKLDFQTIFIDAHQENDFTHLFYLSLKMSFLNVI